MPVRHVRGTLVSTPAVNVLNENPSLVALGKNRVNPTVLYAGYGAARRRTPLAAPEIERTI